MVEKREERERGERTERASPSSFGRPLAQEREPFGVCRLRCNLCQIVAKAGTQRGTMALKGTQDSAQHGRVSGCKFISHFAGGTPCRVGIRVKGELRN